jgi:ribosomal-protein-alanine N-acetyltransferase
MEPDRDTDRAEVASPWVLSSDSLGDTALEVFSGGEDDIEVVCAIESVAHPTPWTRAIFENELELDWSNMWLVRDPDADRSIGFLVFWTIHDEIHILNVAVHPDYRRRGIATEMIAKLEGRAVEFGFAFITLEVREHNTPAIQLYESMGFEVTGRREEYYADTGEAALLMHRLI